MSAAGECEMDDPGEISETVNRSERAAEPQLAATAGVRSVIVVGGGTAGYFAALALKRDLAHLEVTLIESSKIPIIGVGEATTTLMPPFLHRQLGIDIVDLYREVRPTWKLGIKFDWGLPGDYYFTYPFGSTSPSEAYAHDGNIANQSVCAMMMAADRTPIVTGENGEPVSLLPLMKFAYHLDNKVFVAYLRTLAQRDGIHHIDAEIKEVIATPDRESVERLILDDGRQLRADLYIDASGFRSLLIEKALGSRFLSFESSLFCDTALVGEVPQEGPIQPYTTAQTMDAGWCWRIPVEGEDHRGYVYASSYLTADQARAEMRAKNPGLGETWTVRFRSGRHEEFWKGNTVAVGNAYGFVEPLQSTALHMVIMEIAYLIGALRAAAGGEPDRVFANKGIGAHWDYLRWFLAIHYKYNTKKNTAFWRDCRNKVDVSGMESLLEDFCAEGPWDEEGNLRYATGGPVFSFHGVTMILLGQRLPGPSTWVTSISKAEWDARVAEGRALVDRALPQVEALELLRRRPELLQEAVTSTRSWINTGGELITGATRTEATVDPQVDDRVEEAGPYDHLFRGVHPPCPECAASNGVDPESHARHHDHGS
jgi:tryptophan halogenase